MVNYDNLARWRDKVILQLFQAKHVEIAQKRDEIRRPIHRFYTDIDNKIY